MEEAFAFPLEVLMARDSGCFLWATSPMLDQQIALMKSFQFRYIGCIPWAKESKNSGHLDTEDPDHKWHFGPASWFQKAAEFLIAGASGSPTLLDGRKSMRNLLYAPFTGIHSQKPIQQYEIVETLLPGPYLELFSRTTRTGWDVFGDEAGMFDTEGK